MKVKEFPTKLSSVSESVSFIRDALSAYRLDNKKIYTTLLLAEEVIAESLKRCPEKEGGTYSVSVKKQFGNVFVRISVEGESYDPANSLNLGIALDENGDDPETESVIRNLIFRNYRDKIKYKHENGRNTVQILAESSDRKQLFLTLGALLSALLIGFLLKAVASQGVIDGLDHYLLSPVKTIFLNALKMIVGPVVFFSIVSCVAQFTNLSELGKIGAKILGSYLFTTVLAIGTGIGIFFLIRPGSPLASISFGEVAGAVGADQAAEISILDTVIGIVPSNIVKPFLEANMLQIVVIALLCGAAVGMIGDYSRPLKEFFEACNTLFLKITTMIIGFIPLAVFCSMTSMVMTTGTDMLLSLTAVVGTFLAGLVIMILVYCLLILLIGRVNPLTFLKKYAPNMLTTFSLGSSNAAMSLNMDACEKQLGISKKIYSFSIPLGATLNMDGTCVYLAIVGLFLARVYGVELSGSGLMSLVFAIFVLSVGAPAIPGSGIVCLSVLLSEIGVPVEAVSIVMGIDPILGMLRAMSNSTGDVAISLVVARTEKLLDLKKYHAS